MVESPSDAVVERAETRLAAELRAAGFQVEEQTSPDPLDVRWAVERSSAPGPFATVLLRRENDGAYTDVWVADHVSGKTVVRRMAARGVGDAADRALALRVVELMRASLVEKLVMPPTDEPVPPQPVPADVATWTRAAVREPLEGRHSIDLGLGVAGAWGGPDVNVAVAPELRVAWRPNATWSLGLLAAGPAYGARVAATEGSATVRQELAVVEAALAPRAWGPVAPYVTVGGGVYHVATTGYAVPPYSSRSSDVWSALLAGGLGVRLPLSGAASLVLDVRELFALPRPVIDFAGRPVATSMQPGTLAALLLTVSLR